MHDQSPALPLATDWCWLMEHCGFSLYELLSSVSPLEMEEKEVGAYSRLLRQALREKPAPSFSHSSRKAINPRAPATSVSPPRKIDLKKDPKPEKRAKEPDLATAQGQLLNLVRMHPGEETPFFSRAFKELGHPVASTSSHLNSLRKKGLVRSSKKGKGQRVYRWHPAKRQTR